MKTVKSKVCVYDCRTGKMRIEEREMPVYEPTPPQPSPIETVLYHICKLIDPKDDVLDEFVKYYENTFDKTFDTNLKLPVIKNIKETYNEQISWNGSAITKTITVPSGVVKINITGTMNRANQPEGTSAPPQGKSAVLTIEIDENKYQFSTGESKKLNETIISTCTGKINVTMSLGGQFTTSDANSYPASFDITLNIDYIEL